MIGGGALFIDLKKEKNIDRKFFIGDYNEDLIKAIKNFLERLS